MAAQAGELAIRCGNQRYLAFARLYEGICQNLLAAQPRTEKLLLQARSLFEQFGRIINIASRDHAPAGALYSRQSARNGDAPLDNPEQRIKKNLPFAAVQHRAAGSGTATYLVQENIFDDP